VAVFDVITARKRAEKKLNDSERMYRAIGESIDYGIWVCDPEGRNTYASESFLKLVGLTQDQCSEFGWGDVLHPEDAERTIAAWKECVRTRCKWDIEHRFRGVDGHWHPILARGVPVRDEQGKLICWAGINLDIGGLKQMEEELRRSRDELEMRVEERTEELANSHQRLQQLSSQLLQAQEKERKRIAVELHDSLLSELAAMKYLFEGKLMLLRKGQLADTSEFNKVTDIMQKVMKDARGIMNNLRPSILDEMGLIPTIGWLTQEYQKTYGHIQIRRQVEAVEKDIPDVLKVVIFRVLQEALNNFAKHGRGNLVELSLLKSGDALHLRIQDNGQGFDVGNVQKGLGLESMRERVEISGGSFHIESGEGKGTAIRASWSLGEDD
jgi:PAS domain S-box-containing protein